MQQEERFDDEIELIDILRVLWKRKALIVLGTLLLTLVAAGGSYLLPKVHEVTTIVEPGKRPISNENGQIVDEKALQSPESIRQTVLGGAYDGSIRDKLQIPAGSYPKIKADVPKRAQLLKLSIESADPQRAKAVLEEVVAKISNDVEEKIKQERDQIQSDIKLALVEYQGDLEKGKLLKGQIAETKETIKELEGDREKALASRSTDAMVVLLYSDEIQDNRTYLNTLKRNLMDVEQQSEIAKVKVERLETKFAGIKAIKVHKAPTISSNPVKPKKKLIVALAFMLGLMGTTVLAFLVEYVQRSREAESER